MPTNNPRVQVTLSPSLDLLVQQLAKHQRASKSQILRELLEAAEPSLQRVVLMMDAASKASAEVHSGLARSLRSAQTQIERNLDKSLSSVDAMTNDLVALAEEVRARRPGRGRGGAADRARTLGGAPENPPASNRGVKSPITAKKRPPLTTSPTTGGKR